MAKRKHRKPFEPALEGASDRDKGVCVSRQRCAWKEKHAKVTDDMIRMVRFVWMRSAFSWDLRHALHATVFGQCLREGLLEVAGSDEIQVTRYGELRLAQDRRAS